MSIVELIVYIALVGSFLATGVFSTYNLIISTYHDSDRIDEVMNKTGGDGRLDGGFVALISTLTIALGLFLIALSLSMKGALYFDQVVRREYRFISRGYAYACLDQALVGLAQDYFYVVKPTDQVHIKQWNCDIRTVNPDFTHSRFGFISNDSRDRFVDVIGTHAGIHTEIEAQVRLYDHRIELVKKDFILF